MPDRCMIVNTDRVHSVIHRQKDQCYNGKNVISRSRPLGLLVSSSSGGRLPSPPLSALWTRWPSWSCRVSFAHPWPGSWSSHDLSPLLLAEPEREQCIMTLVCHETLVHLWRLCMEVVSQGVVGTRVMQYTRCTGTVLKCALR